MTTVTGLSLADSNGFFDTQAVATEASFIESAGTIDELGNPASTLDPQVGADDDWNEPVADISIKTNLIAPVIASIDDCSLAPKQHSRRKQRRQNGFCQNPDAPGILPLQPESNRKPRKRKGANFNSPTNEKKTDRNPPTLEINPVPTSDQNPCQPERHYQVCAARFFQVAPSSISLENRPWTEDSDLNPGDQIFCRLYYRPPFCAWPIERHMCCTNVKGRTDTASAILLFHDIPIQDAPSIFDYPYYGINCV